MDKIKEMQQELLEQCALRGRPGSALEECLAACGPEMLRRIAMGNELEIPEKINEKKAQELRLALKECIPPMFERKRLYLLPEQRAFLRMALESKDRPVEEVDFGAFTVLSGLGAVFLFWEEEQFYLVVPEEIQKALTAGGIDTSHWDQGLWARSDELWTYALALVNLYGVYDSGWFSQVWNQHHREKITPQMAEAYLQVMWNLQFYYWYHDGFAIAAYFESEEILDAFLEVAADVPYYMPTKRDIAYYFDHEYNEDSPYFRRLEDFFAGWAERESDRGISAGEIMAVVGYACVLDLDELSVLDELERMGVLIADPAEEKEFLLLFAGLSADSRKWTLCGWRTQDQ